MHHSYLFKSPLQGQNCIHPPICSFALIVMGDGYNFELRAPSLWWKQPNTDQQMLSVCGKYIQSMLDWLSYEKGNVAQKSWETHTSHSTAASLSKLNMSILMKKGMGGMKVEWLVHNIRATVQRERKRESLGGPREEREEDTIISFSLQTEFSTWKSCVGCDSCCKEKKKEEILLAVLITMRRMAQAAYKAR